MLITFHTKSYADITLFGDIGKQLIELMGHTPIVPGAILAEDVPAALARLRAGVAANSAHAKASDKKMASDKNNVQSDDEERPISLANRALPLISLLEAAAKAKENVMWD